MSELVNTKVKIILILLLISSLPLGFKAMNQYLLEQKTYSLIDSIKSKKACGQETIALDCARQEFLFISKNVVEPMKGQQFLSEIVKIELERHPESARYLKDQYFIYTAEFYIQSLKEKQKSLISYVPYIAKNNLNIQLAKRFLGLMTDYSNRREVDRTIASETILQEVSNFNGAHQELTRLIESFE